MFKAIHLSLSAFFLVVPLLFVIVTVFAWSGGMSVAQYKALVDIFILDYQWYIGGFIALFLLLLVFEAKLD